MGPEHESAASRPAAPRDPAELWSWVDRDDPRLAAHLAAHPGDAERVRALRAGIGAVRAGADPLPERIGAYEVVRVLGEGAMGVVYEALQASPRRRVAVKVLRAALGDARATERFEREAAVLARLSHPGIAVIHEAGRGADGRAFLALELVEGLTLLDHARERGLGLRARVELLRAVCAAVQHAHARGVVHRDLKPSNVLVDGAGQPKVLDFGLARLADAAGAAGARATLSGTVLGTPAYMSPEQARGDSAGPASDVYALGVMLYELVTGALPIEVAGRALVEAARRVCEQTPRRPSRLVPGLERELEAVLLRCLEKDPARRYANAGALGDELANWLDGRPVLARPPSATRRLASFVRRHHAGVAAGTVAWLAVCLASFALLFPAELPWSITGDWIREGAPFEALRWRGDVPEVALEGRWYELVAIEDLDTAYVTGFCRQYAGTRWRKRFSEDLVQVLNRMRVWSLFEVDLTLRELETGALVTRADVALDRELRQRIYQDRDRFPFELQSSALWQVDYLGRVWRLVSVEGVAADELDLATHGCLYDAVSARAGHSPRARIDFVLEDEAHGTRTEFRAVPRAGADAHAAQGIALAERTDE